MISALLVHDEYGTSKGGTSTINRRVALQLVALGVRVFCTVLTASEKDKNEAERENVTLLFPRRHKDDTREPSLSWLLDHQTRFPHIPSDISYVIGHIDVTSRAAVKIKEERLPDAKLFFFTHVSPEDTERYKGEGRELKIEQKINSILEDAEKADVLFSVGPYIYDYYTNLYRSLQDKSKPHFMYLPKPPDIFINTRLTYVETQTKVVLSFGRVSGVEKLKGYDIAANAMNHVAERFPWLKWRVRGISRDDFPTSKKIIDSGTFHFTPLEYGTQEQIGRDMEQAHLILMPSRAEPFGLVGLEAVAAGVPVLVSDKSGLAMFMKNLAPEFDRSTVTIGGNDEEDSRNLATKITRVLQNGRQEFDFAKQLKDKLLGSEYWKESQQKLCQVCGVESATAGLDVKPKGKRVASQDAGEDLPSKHLKTDQDSAKTSRQKAPSRQDRQEQTSQVTDVFQKSVKDYYQLKLTTLKPLIWNDSFTLTLSDIFTELELIKKRDKRFQMPQRQKLESLDDLFNPDVTGRSTAPRCILIEGEAGGGKTTFLSKKALDAVSQKTELSKRHDIVLLIRLREVREGETIEEMVLDQCVPETTEGVDVQSIRAILQRNESRVLFLLDGYDELRPGARVARQAIPKLLAGKMYLNSTIVITSRPSAGVQQYTPDCHVHIMGFSPKHVEKYVRRYFSITGNPELAEKLITVLKKSQVVTDLIHTPIFLSYVCLLWEDKETREMVSAGTMTGLYKDLFKVLGRKHCKREGVDMPTDGLPADVAQSLLQLGKLALEALLGNETLLELTQVERENVNWKLLLKLGVVSLEVSASKLHPRNQLNFSHKTMQEFLAGRYVAHALENQDIVELLKLTSITMALELSNLLQFTCGRDSRAAQAVMEELSKLSHKEFSHLKADDFKEKSHIPVKPEVRKLVETYRRFVLLCLEILNERKEPDVLQAVSRALPVIFFDLRYYNFRSSKQDVGLQYYLENIQPSNLPNRMILGISCVDVTEALQYLEQIFTSPIPGLRLDLKLNSVEFDSRGQMARLVTVLKNIPSLRALNLYHTKLTPSILQPLVQGFRHVSLLEELDLTWNSALGDARMEVLQVGLSSVPQLTVLRLGWVSMTAVGMSSLAPYMRHLVGLRELDISHNKIGDTGLGSLTTVFSTLTAMQVLCLRKNGISPTGMRTLVTALCQLTRLIKLDFSDNDIGDSGLERLADILPHLTAMKVLVLSRTCISNRGMSFLVKALPHLVELQVLSVGYNSIGDSGIVSLVQTLCQSSSLDIEENPAGDKSLTKAPHGNTTLQELYIAGNRVTGAGLGRVAQLIRTLPALTRLHMSGPSDSGTTAHLSDTDAMALAQALTRLPTLKRLYLQYISMESAGFQAVVQAAEEHPALERLRYSGRLVPKEADTTASCLELLVD